MLDITPIILTVIAMILYSIALFILSAIIKRTRNELKQTMIYFFIAVFILTIRRAVNLLNLSALYNAEVLDDSFAILASLFFLMSAITLFRDIHKMTDVDVNKTKAARLPPPRHVSSERRERMEQPRRFQEKREPAGFSAKDLIRR